MHSQLHRILRWLIIYHSVLTQVKQRKLALKAELRSPRRSCRTRETKLDNETRHEDAVRTSIFEDDTSSVGPRASPRSWRARKFRNGDINHPWEFRRTLGMGRTTKRTSKIETAMTQPGTAISRKYRNPVLQSACGWYVRGSNRHYDSSPSCPTESWTTTAAFWTRSGLREKRCYSHEQWLCTFTASCNQWSSLT